MELGSLGLTPVSEEIYRIVLSEAVIDVGSVGSSAGISGAEASEALESLRELGLVTRAASKGEYSAVDPRSALRSLVDRRGEQLERARRTVGALGAVFERSQQARQAPTGSRVLSGSEAVGDWYYRLKTRATADFLAFDRPPYVSSSNSSLNRELLARGVRVRAIYSAESFESEGTWAAVRALVGLGEEARVAPKLPIKLAIADHSIALISLDTSPDDPQALVTESALLIDTLMQLFDVRWEASFPISGTEEDASAAVPETYSDSSSPPDDSRRRPRRDEHELLAMIAAGVKDDVIARHLGQSSRTLRRRMQNLFSELGATNRFSAGVEAARRGWV